MDLSESNEIAPNTSKISENLLNQNQSSKKKRKITKNILIKFIITVIAIIALGVGIIVFYCLNYSSDEGKPEPGPKPEKLLTILALGDSICQGVRNSYKGFVGDLGYPYINIGVGGATMSTKNPNRVPIPQQLLDYYNKTKDNETISDPDFILSNGGVNDYYYMAPLGDIPKVAVKTDEEAEKLNRDTILGALEYLFYKMIKFYPKAYKFFILGHKTTYKASTQNATFVDWTITKNTEGYTQTELYEYIKVVCRLYDVIYVDIFNLGIINSAFDEYCSPVSYNDDHNVTFIYFVDKDKLHPLDFGYRMGYVPLLKKAMKPYFPKDN